MHVLAVATALLLAAVSAVSVDPAASPHAEQVPVLEWEVVARLPHDPEAFTQGLVFDEQGRLFESTGLRGRSSVREVDPATGDVLRRRSQPDRQFSEGLAAVGPELIQLTWTDGLARRYDADSLGLRGWYRYEGQGWGLCFDGQRLVMSDGSDRLTFRDAVSFEVLGSVGVTIGGEPRDRLNELECVGDEVWSNVWLTDIIVRIDPADGRVTGDPRSHRHHRSPSRRAVERQRAQRHRLRRGGGHLPRDRQALAGDDRDPDRRVTLSRRRASWACRAPPHACGRGCPRGAVLRAPPRRAAPRRS